MKRIYQGNYFVLNQQGNKSPVEFRMEVEIDNKLDFNGTVWEEEFYNVTGRLSSVKGFIDESHISFVKQYPCIFEKDGNGRINIDESRLGHEVIYDGYWDNDKGIWEGEREVEGYTEVFQLNMTKIFLGEFEMKMVNE